MQAAYLKAHYPAEFMAAVLANGGGFYSAWAYVEEARRMGLAILPPDVNRAGRVFQAENGAIRVGFAHVKSLTQRAADAIIEQRPFHSIADFLARVPISLKECENLIECGAMDGFEGNRPEKIWRLNETYASLRRRKAAPAGSPVDETRALFAGLEPELPTVPHVNDYSLAERLDFERRVLDFCVTAHPMTLHRHRYDSGEWTPAARAADCPGRRITVAGWPITAKGTTTTGGERMRFVSLEDHTGIIEVVFFPDVYRRHARQLHNAPLVVAGRVSVDEGVPTLEADSAAAL